MTTGSHGTDDGGNGYYQPGHLGQFADQLDAPVDGGRGAALVLDDQGPQPLTGLQAVAFEQRVDLVGLTAKSDE